MGNMSSAVCASSIYSPLCMKMSSFLFLRLWTMPRMLYSSCGIPYPVETPGIISGDISCDVAVKVRSHQKNFRQLLGEGVTK